LQDRLADVVDCGGLAFLGELAFGELLSGEHRGQLLHLRRVGARTMQIGTARAVDGTRILPVQRQYIARAAGRILEVDMRQALPTPANSDHLAADLAASVDHCFDYGI